MVTAELSVPDDYPLGYSEAEARRLAAQAALFDELTEDVLRRAGLRTGMQVLDLGCGIGDVSLLVGRMVGPSGAVLGLDRAASSIETARRRAVAVGAANVRFEEAELKSFDTTRTFDAVVGRFVLLFLADPAELLRRLRHCVRPGGVVAFHEMDVEASTQVPASELHNRVIHWIHAACMASGTELNMGSKLLATFLRAGLPRPTMIAAARVESGPQSPAYDLLAGVVRSLLPLIERTGVATVEEVEIETLSDRLRQDAVAHERVIFLPRLVGAWSRLGGS
jgi:ubiquinone/menaquinone biosynthesis C-methylase UbiE